MLREGEEPVRSSLAVLLVILAALIVTPATRAEQAPRTFVAVLTAAEEIPLCAPATNASRGVAVFHVIDQAAGTVRYRLVANNLPGDITAAHIHVGATGVRGGIVEPLPLTPGAENGVIGEGTFTNAALLAALQATPQNYYVNVHSTTCGTGVIRGQLGEQGPR
jgi:hypothetical protein